MHTHVHTYHKYMYVTHAYSSLHVCTETKSPQVHSYTNSSTCTHRGTKTYNKCIYVCAYFHN